MVVVVWDAVEGRKEPVAAAHLLDAVALMVVRTHRTCDHLAVKLYTWMLHGPKCKAPLTE